MDKEVLFTKYGYNPIINAVKIVNLLYERGYEIYLCSYVRKTRYSLYHRSRIYGN